MVTPGKNIIWLIGRTRRERVASFLSLASGCAAFLWGMINEMSYGHEDGDGPDQLSTNGRWDVDVVLKVFFSLIGVCVFFFILFWIFRLLDKERIPTEIEQPQE
jgi:hypothetical protein